MAACNLRRREAGRLDSRSGVREDSAFEMIGSWRCHMTERHLLSINSHGPRSGQAQRSKRQELHRSVVRSLSEAFELVQKQFCEKKLKVVSCFLTQTVVISKLQKLSLLLDTIMRRSRSAKVNVCAQSTYGVKMALAKGKMKSL